jgi:hypothetical protein
MLDLEWDDKWQGSLMFAARVTPIPKLFLSVGATVRQPGPGEAGTLSKLKPGAHPAMGMHA